MNQVLEGIFRRQSTVWEREGWSVFSTNCGYYEIQRIDDPSSLDFECTRTFDNDGKAVAHVLDRAMRGSLTHMFAVWVDGQSFSYVDDLLVGVPAVFHSLLR